MMVGRENYLIDAQVIYKKYLKNISLNHADKALVAKKIHKVLHKIINGGDYFLLTELVIDLKRTFSDDVILVALSATNDYVNSKHFNFEGKWVTRDYLWEENKNIYENKQNPFRENLTSYLNNLISRLSEENNVDNIKSML